MPQESSIRTISSALLGCPTMTSARTPANASSSAPLGASVGASTGKDTQKEKTLPLPTSLSRRSLPPISVTSWFEIASPRPVPPYLRSLEASAWVKAWKTLFF